MNRLLQFIILLSATKLIAMPRVHWWNDVVLYEIFVRSYQDSNDDGIGDLNGIRQRLDFLNGESNSLGVGALWLTPIFPSPSYHGYDVTDYRDINPEYGTMADFDSLVREAHQRGIKIVLDIPVNHSSSLHPWFEDAKTSSEADYRNWFVWRSQKQQWGKWYPIGEMFYYSVFGSGMPQLNWKNMEVKTEVKNIFDFWIKKGVDGFRLDAARYYVPGPNGEPDTFETHQAIQEFANALRTKYPEVVFIGEIWASSKEIASYYHEGRELDMAFSFPVAYGLLDSLKQNTGSRFASTLMENKSDIADAFFNSPFLTNHDMDRIGSQLNGDEKKLKLAASVLMGLPGTPVVYYGEELGYKNGTKAKPFRDTEKRKPMQWNEEPGFGFTNAGIPPWQAFVGQAEKYSVTAQEQGDTLLNHYRNLIHLRNGNEALRRGKIENIYHHHESEVVSWQRVTANSTIVVTANFKNTPSKEWTIPLKLADGNITLQTMQLELLKGVNGARIVSEGNRIKIKVPSQPAVSASFYLVRGKDNEHKNTLPRE